MPVGAHFAPFADFTDRPDRTVHAVAVFEAPEGNAALDEILGPLGNPFLPVADFTGANSFRHDISSTRSALREGLQDLYALASSMPKTPQLPGGADRNGLFCLGVALTRRRPIRAAWNPGLREALWYPAIGSGVSGRRLLEDLANVGLLRRQFAHRLHQCDSCESHRLHVFESCTSCGSGYLDEESVVHHFSCGAQGPESRFLSGHELICPKCGKALRHFGVDYARPGQLLVCKACEETMPEPDIRFVCSDCGANTVADRLNTQDWFDYEISDEGIDVFKLQRLPAVSFDDLLEPHDRAFSRREFRLLALEALRLATRYERPFTAVRIELENNHELRRSLGVIAVNEAESLIVDLLVEQLRDTDIFTNNADSELLAVLPETTEQQAMAALDRFKSRVGEIVAGKIRLNVSFVSADELQAVLEAEQ